MYSLQPQRGWASRRRKARLCVAHRAAPQLGHEPQPPRADLTAKFYHKYADPKNGSSHWALTLPELAEWSHNENFCGSEDVAASVRSVGTGVIAVRTQGLEPQTSAML